MTIATFLRLHLLAIAWIILPSQDDPVVRPDPEVTWITDHVKPNGDVDYEAWFNQTRSKNLVPFDNFIIDVVEISGSTIFAGDVPPEYAAMLGLSLPLDESNTFTTFEDWLKTQNFEPGRAGWPADDEGKPISANEYKALARSVSLDIEKHPLVTAWLNEQKALLDRVRFASCKSGCFAPLFEFSELYTWWRGGDLEPDYSFETTRLLDGLTIALGVSIASDELEQAIDDFLVMERISRLLGSNTTSKGYVHACMRALRSVQQLARIIYSGKCTSQQLARVADEMKKMGEPLVVDTDHLACDRCAALVTAREMIGTMAFGKKQTGADELAIRTPRLSAPQLLQQKFRAFILRLLVDWPAVFRHINNHYDLVESIAREFPANNDMAAADSERYKRLEELEDNIVKGSKTLLSRPFIKARIRQRNGVFEETLGYMILSLVYDGIHLFHLERKVRTHWRLMETTVAVERYKLENHELPHSLQELVPRYLTAVPIDLYSGQPLVYIPDAAKYRLYSVGPNLRDDGGVDPYNSEDFVFEQNPQTETEWLRELAREKNDQSPQE